MVRKRERNQTFGVLDRFLAILDCFTPERQRWTVTDLANELRIPKSTAHRLLTQLEDRAVLARDPDLRFRPGSRLIVWGGWLSQKLDEEVSPILKSLSDQSAETVILTMLDRDMVVCTHKVESNQSLRITLEIGRRVYPHAGASAKVLMAHLSNDDIDRVIASNGLPKLCTNTITDAQQLKEHLAEIRRLGYAVSHEETDIGVTGIACPVRDAASNFSIGIGIAAPAARLHPDVFPPFIEMVREAADELSFRLEGWSRR